MRCGTGRVDQQRFGRAANAGAPHFRIEHDVARHIEIGVTVDIDVADAFEMGEDRHARLVLHAGNEALAAARHDHVEIAVEPAQHFADGGAVGNRHQLDRRLGQAGGDDAFEQ